MTRVSQFHLSFGLIFFVAFLVTGLYMLLGFPQLFDGREEVRMMYRATHIYLLMSALLNLMAAHYVRALDVVNFLNLRYLASLFLLLAPPVLLTAFLIEPQAYQIHRPFTFWGVIALVAGVGLHSLVELPWLQQFGQRSDS